MTSDPLKLSKTFLIKENPFECGPLDSIPISMFSDDTFSDRITFSSSTHPTEKPAKSKLFSV